MLPNDEESTWLRFTVITAGVALVAVVFFTLLVILVEATADHANGMEYGRTGVWAIEAGKALVPGLLVAFTFAVAVLAVHLLTGKIPTETEVLGEHFVHVRAYVFGALMLAIMLLLSTWYWPHNNTLVMLKGTDANRWGVSILVHAMLGLTLLGALAVSMITFAVYALHWGDLLVLYRCEAVDDTPPCAPLSPTLALASEAVSRRVKDFFFDMNASDWPGPQPETPLARLTTDEFAAALRPQIEASVQSVTHAINATPSEQLRGGQRPDVQRMLAELEQKVLQTGLQLRIARTVGQPVMGAWAARYRAMRLAELMPNPGPEAESE